MKEQVLKQREYYNKSAHCYDEMCAFDNHDEHFLASAILSGFINHFAIRSILDVGCGTGRTLNYLYSRHPDLMMIGIDPVEAMRIICQEKDMGEVQILDGDACSLPLATDSIDCVCMYVCMYGVLHHIPCPEKAITEAFRVAKKFVFISDHNIYAMGSFLTKSIKKLFRLFGMKVLLRALMTRGKGYHDTDWDGVFYPFSLIDHFRLFENNSGKVLSFSTKTNAVNLLNDASHIALLCIK